MHTHNRYRYLRLYAAIVSLSLRRSFAFRANLVAETLVSVINVAASLAILRSVFWIADSLHGWSDGEATVLLGLYLIASGLLGACIEPNLRWFRDQILQGQLDDILVRPASSAFLASLGTCSPFPLSQALAGIAVLALGLRALDATPSPPNAVLAGMLFATGCLSIWAIRLILASLAFWAPSAQPDVGFRALWEFGRYPVSVYARPVRLALTCVVPVALVATIPTQILAGRLGWTGIGIAILVCGVMVAAARRVWLAGLRRYTSATS